MFLSISSCAMGNRLVFMPMKSFTQFTLFLPLLPQSSCSHFFLLAFHPVFFPPSPLSPTFTLSFLPHSSPFSILFLPISFPPVLTSTSSPLAVNTVIAWGALQCITDLSPLVLFMALSLFKFNQPSMEPPEPFQFTTWTPQDGKSYANIKV